MWHTVHLKSARSTKSEKSGDRLQLPASGYTRRIVQTINNKTQKRQSSCIK